jgi:hypothetical protein
MKIAREEKRKKLATMASTRRPYIVLLPPAGRFMFRGEIFDGGLGASNLVLFIYMGDRWICACESRFVMQAVL